MTELRTTTPKRPHVTHQRTVPQFTTPRNPSITPLQATTKLRLLFAAPRPPSIKIQPSVNYGAVLLLVVLSLMAWLTTGVPMSPGYGGYQTATPASYHTHAATGYYTPKALEYYTITSSVPNFYTEASKLNSALSYTTKAAEYYTTKAAEYYTTKAAEYYTTKAAEYYTEALKFYSVLSYHTIKEAEHYTTNASATYYMEISKC